MSESDTFEINTMAVSIDEDRIKDKKEKLEVIADGGLEILNQENNPSMILPASSHEVRYDEKENKASRLVDGEEQELDPEETRKRLQGKKDREQPESNKRNNESR